MKKLWKALGITALAAVVPLRVKEDENGVKRYQSLLWKLEVPPKTEEGREISIDLMEGLLTTPLMNAIAARQEAELFADNEPEAAVIAAGADTEEEATEETLPDDEEKGMFDPEA